MTAQLLSVRALRVGYRHGEDVLQDVCFDLAQGKCLAVLGESGSGKSTIARALMGLLPAGATCAGALQFAGSVLDAQRMVAVRGREIAMVFQDAAASLHPLRRIGVQIDEALRRANNPRGVASALAEVGLDDTPTFAARHPHELSGGQRQRVMIALALASSPRLLIADEITSALDPVAAAGVLDLLTQLRHARGLSVLFISHDLHAVRRVADRVLLLRDGRVDAVAAAATFFSAPPSAAARALLAVAQRGGPPAVVSGDAVLRVRGLQANHAQRPALRDISFELPRAAALGVVGASGSGKSTLARVLLALQRGVADELCIAGADPFALPRAARKAWRRKVQIVFQDPGTALDPRMRVGDSLREPLQLHGLGDATAQEAKVRELLAAVRLDEGLVQRRPHELSGGQKQRVAIARALALDPEVLVCDEAVSALDLSVQAGILDLLRELQRTRGLTLVFVSHDFDAVHALCDRVLVLDQGRVVDQGATHAVFAALQGARIGI
jgi:peptide/nickel transport system ATP-binding protein